MKIDTNTVNMTIRLDKDEAQKAKLVAASLGITVNAYVALAVTQTTKTYLATEGNQTMPTTTTRKISVGKRIRQGLIDRGCPNPANFEFQPMDTGIEASSIGSFSDYAVNGTTKSSKYSRRQYLIPVKMSQSGRPLTYKLVFNYVRVFDIDTPEFDNYSEFQGKKGYSFEILGVRGNLDFNLVCTQAFPTEEDAERAGNELVANGRYTHLPKGLDEMFIENTFAHHRVNLKKHVLEDGTVAYSAYWPFLNRKGEPVANLGFSNFISALEAGMKKLGSQDE